MSRFRVRPSQPRQALNKAPAFTCFFDGQEFQVSVGLDECTAAVSKAFDHPFDGYLAEAVERDTMRMFVDSFRSDIG